jgi:hypothetical protein
MDEILQKLLSSELLTENAKAEISSEWNMLVEQYKETVREQESMKVRAELAEQWIEERDAINNTVDEFTGKILEAELAELRADIENFRDLEVEYAGKLLEAKNELKKEYASDMAELLEKMDEFFELRLSEEFEELREDLEFARQNEFGRKIFEAFSTEFNSSYVDSNSIQAKLSVTKNKLKDAHDRIFDLEEEKDTLIRESKLEKILAPLSGKKREQMQLVLANVETERLDEAFNHFIDRVVQDSVPARREAVTPLKESVTDAGANKSSIATQSDEISRLKKLAGIE